jgi:DNA-binding NarL/FixJ family response regulator
MKHTPPSKLLEAIEEVHRGGSPMSSEIARKVVESFQSSVVGTNIAYGLTKREEEILSYLAKGYLYKEIADLTNISLDTVRSHIRHIYEKLQVKTRTQAILIYFQK